MDETLDPVTGEPAYGIQRLLGFRVTEWSEDRAVVELKLTADHLNRSGVVHGGVLTTLLDTALGFSGLYCPYPGRIRRAVTLSLTTSFTGQAREGVIRAIGTRRAGGRRIYNATGEVLDADGRILALGEGTFRLRSGSETLDGEPL
jgi:uncharacterized protein (TIGR00369 family)